MRNALFALGLLVTSCHTLDENPAATSACADAGPGSGSTDIACTHCCQSNGAIGRHSDSTRCACIGKK
jgi:hypothetical protein